MGYHIKRAGQTITDVDAKAGRVTGYFSVFGNLDADGDIMMPGAYRKGLSETGDRVLHLYQHDVMRPLSSVRSGKLIVKEDNRGLYFDSTITKTSWGMDVIKLIEDKVLTENSIGFHTIKAMNTKAGREIREARMMEGSSVSFGANPEAMNLKSLYTIEEVEDRQASVIKALRSGKYENEKIFDSLEIYLAQLTGAISDMKSTEPAEQLAVEPEVDEEVRKGIKSLNELFTTRPQAAHFASKAAAQEQRRQSALEARRMNRFRQQL